jgi:glutamate-1-semialdehyde aminotransferase
MPDQVKSWDERSRDVLAQGCLTYSKRSDQFVKGVYPTHVTGGDGYKLFGADGKMYVDFICGLASNIICVNNNYSLPTTAEVLLAEAIRDRVPCCEKLRILKTGSEACQAAVRIARAYEENKKQPGANSVNGQGYHGWHNVFISEEDPGTGTVPEGYNKCKTIDEVIAKIESPNEGGAFCACIIEPVQLDISDEHIAKLRKLRDLCTKRGIVLIFDEVITGFRVPKYTIANYFGIQPDIICLGKALANGHPISVVGGKREIMDTPGWFVSSTFAGELESIVSAGRVLEVLDEAALDELWHKGQWFQKIFNSISSRIQLVGIPTKAIWKAESEEFRALFFQEMCKKGYLIGKAWHIMVAHDVQILEQFLADADKVITMINTNAVGLEGELPGFVFKRY